VGVVVADVPALTLLLGEGVKVDDDVPVQLLDAVAVSEAVSLDDGLSLPLAENDAEADQLALLVTDGDWEELPVIDEDGDDVDELVRVIVRERVPVGERVLQKA
jgi:hypothetical protein